MAESNALTRQFDDAAQLYDEVRPRYPETIVEQIIAFAGLPAHGRIFEVGCGTGQMTLPFAQRGYTMVAIDQGERLAALAAQHCQPYPRVRVVPCAFESLAGHARELRHVHGRAMRSTGLSRTTASDGRLSC